MAALECERDCGANVVVLVFEAREPGDLLLAPREMRARLLGERHEVLEVPASQVVVLPQSLERVLAHDLEHGEPRLASHRLALAKEALVDEHAEFLEDGPVDAAAGFGGSKRAAAGKHTELRE